MRPHTRSFNLLKLVLKEVFGLISHSEKFDIYSMSCPTMYDMYLIETYTNFYIQEVSYN